MDAQISLEKYRFLSYTEYKQHRSFIAGEGLRPTFYVACGKCGKASCVIKHSVL